jgi:cyclohexanone monooxygenase
VSDPSRVHDADQSYDAIVVGAGLAGLYALHRLRASGLRVLVLEAADAVGGTWYWNSYPGARCDVESLYYSYSFSPELEQEWQWSERYPSQPELLRYIDHVADRFDLRRHIEFATRVRSATFREQDDAWLVEAEDGRSWTARFTVYAVGCLSAPLTPRFAGIDDFAGSWYQTQDWPKEPVDFTGKVVGVIGTGSSGIQCIPVIAEQAEHVYVFQRTANFSVPARNAPLDPAVQEAVKARYREIRAEQRSQPVGFGADVRPGTGSALAVGDDERDRLLEERWARGGSGAFNAVFPDLLTSREANQAVADFVRRKIRSTVADPAVAERLVPRDHPISARRLCVDSHYFETFNRDDVTLVDLRDEPVDRLVPAGVRTSRREYPVDVLVFALGYDALTGSLLRVDVVGRDGLRLRDAWEQGPRTYLGLAVAGFPNMFTITGPGSPSVLAVMTVAIEQHVEWIADCIAHVRAAGATRVEATVEAQDRWTEHVAEVADGTLYPSAASYYTGANVPGKPRAFLPYAGGLDVYRRRCDEVAASGYDGFVLSQRAATPG